MGNSGGSFDFDSEHCPKNANVLFDEIPLLLGQLDVDNLRDARTAAYNLVKTLEGNFKVLSRVQNEERWILVFNLCKNKITGIMTSTDDDLRQCGCEISDFLIRLLGPSHNIVANDKEFLCATIRAFCVGRAATQSAAAGALFEMSYYCEQGSFEIINYSGFLSHISRMLASENPTLVQLALKVLQSCANFSERAAKAISADREVLSQIIDHCHDPEIPTLQPGHRTPWIRGAALATLQRLSLHAPVAPALATAGAIIAAHRWRAIPRDTLRSATLGHFAYRPEVEEEVRASSAHAQLAAASLGAGMRAATVGARAGVSQEQLDKLAVCGEIPLRNVLYMAERAVAGYELPGDFILPVKAYLLPLLDILRVDTNRARIMRLEGWPGIPPVRRAAAAAARRPPPAADSEEVPSWWPQDEEEDPAAEQAALAAVRRLDTRCDGRGPWRPGHLVRTLVCGVLRELRRAARLQRRQRRRAASAAAASIEASRQAAGSAREPGRGGGGGAAAAAAAAEEEDGEVMGDRGPAPDEDEWGRVKDVGDDTEELDNLDDLVANRGEKVLSLATPRDDQREGWAPIRHLRDGHALPPPKSWRHRAPVGPDEASLALAVLSALAAPPDHPPPPPPPRGRRPSAAAVTAAAGAAPCRCGPCLYRRLLREVASSEAGGEGGAVGGRPGGGEASVARRPWEVPSLRPLGPLLRAVEDDARLAAAPVWASVARSCPAAYARWLALAMSRHPRLGGGGGAEKKCWLRELDDLLLQQIALQSWSVGSWAAALRTHIFA